ncbi:MAG TPA: hypothetical protein VM536_12675 [Chloroflexia bacterium]|nr:hypothetical protein [Chloroflexia bacterium]
MPDPPTGPTGAAYPTPTLVDTILAYLRAHRDTYARDALTAALLAADYPPAEVDLAWRILASDDAWG